MALSGPAKKGRTSTVHMEKVPKTATPPETKTAGEKRKSQLSDKEKEKAEPKKLLTYM